ncbi:MAG: hypothetical protein R3C15_13655 [Thermoleophilia bacterium]
MAGSRPIAVLLVRRGRAGDTGDDAGEACGRIRYAGDVVQVVQAPAPAGARTVRATLRLATARGTRVASTTLRLRVQRATIDPPTSPDGTGGVTTLHGLVVDGRYGLGVVVDSPGGCAPQLSRGDSPRRLVGRVELVDLARTRARVRAAPAHRCDRPPRAAHGDHGAVDRAGELSAPFGVVVPQASFSVRGLDVVGSRASLPGRWW